MQMLMVQRWLLSLVLAPWCRPVAVAFQSHAFRRRSTITPATVSCHTSQRLFTTSLLAGPPSFKHQQPIRKATTAKRRKQPSKTSNSSIPSSSSMASRNSTRAGKTSDLVEPSTVIRDAHSTSKVAELRERHREGMSLTQSYCDSVLGLCVAANDWDSAWEVMQIMANQGLSSQERNTYKACLQSCFEFGNGVSAREILTAMSKADMKPDPVDVSLVVAAMCKQNQREDGWWKQALLLLKSSAVDAVASGNLDETKLVPVEAYDAVLSCFVRTENWKEAARLLHLMEQPNSGHPDPTVSTYRFVIETCVLAKQAEQSFQVLMSMSKRGIKPTVYTFELIISALAQKLQWRRALQLLDMMDNMQVQKTLIIYNTVISACAKAGEVGSAKNLLLKMRKAGIKPDIFSFNSVMTACARGHRWQDALTILDECHREPGVEPDIITYTNAIRACTMGGKTVRALNILQVVKDKRLPLDNYAYTAAIDACAKGRMWQRALELLDEMETNGVVPNAITYSVAITACGNGGQWEKALRLLDEVRYFVARFYLFNFVLLLLIGTFLILR
jgi:pentatricopeptide repeat protein